jgi:hypothetical protein
LAVVLHGYPRLTRDIDLLIRIQDLEAAREVLASAGFTIPGGLIPFDTGRPRQRKLFRMSKAIGDDLLTVDLLLLPEFLEEVWQSRETYELDGVLVTVVSVDGLITMKKIAGRHQDLGDVEQLESAP